ncbi:membrane protein insertase YidC [candidate division WOR-3 bacterium]|nr:membrane protein insertase YidC [candidate division WOR-3 bacterium]
MDKKSIIGILLIFLVLILWQSLMVRKAPKEESKGVEEQRRKEIPQEIVKPPEMKLPESVSLKLDTVDTPLFRIVLTSLGASAQSIKLKKYESALPEDKNLPEPWVELIPPEKKVLEDIIIVDGKGFNLSNEVFNLVSKTPTQLIYEFVLPSKKKIQKIYTFSDSSYIFDLKLNIPNADRYEILWQAGVKSTEKNEAMGLRYFGGLVSLGGITVLKSLNKLDTIPKGEQGDIDWIGVKNKYFLAAIVPRVETESYSMKRFALGNVGGGCAMACAPAVKDPEAKRVGISLLTRSSGAYNFKIYTGPLDYDKLLGLGLGLQEACYLGMKWIRPISRFFLKLFKVLNKGISNYGLVIIVFSLMMTIVFYPLTRISHKSMHAMQQIQPKLKELQKRYKKDSKKLSQETMALYRKHGVSPLSGCLPMLIQLPVFFALYAILDTTIALRGAVFIPHWIEDLSQSDPYFALPILMGGTMFLQQKIQGSSMSMGQGSQQKMMAYFMPIMMTVIFLRFPAGLVLYWFMYNIFAMIQTYMIKKETANKTSFPSLSRPKLLHSQTKK